MNKEIKHLITSAHSIATGAKAVHVAYIFCRNATAEVYGQLQQN